MGNNTLLAGTALMLLLLVPVWLSPQESLHPSRRTLILLGVAGGLVSIAAFEALRWNAPELHIVAYPTATAFVALFFGVPAAAITAVLALQAALWTDTSAVWPATTVLGGALATGWAWRSLSQRWAWPDWAPLAGLTLTLPLVVSLVTTATSTAPEGTSNMHWHHGAGVLMLGIGWLVIASRARAELARNEIQQTLGQQEHQLRLALDALGGGRWEWDVVERRFFCDGRFYEAYGITSADLKSPDLWQRWYARRHPLDAERNASKLARAMDGAEESYEAEFRVMDTQGRWRWLMSRGTVARRDAQGRPASLIGMDVDISAHREAEEALQSAEAKYTTFYQTLPDPAGITRIADGRYIDVNPAFCELLGFTREEVLGRTSSELHIWANEHERKRLLDTYQREGKVDRLPLVAQSKGVQVPGLMSARSVLVNGENCFVFVFHDMTEAQRTSDELRALYNQLQQAGRLARLGAWEDERGRGLVYWSDVCFDIHGLSPNQPPPSDYIDRHVAPQYREPLREKFRQSIRSRAEWSMEMEVYHADGHLFWVRARGEPVIENGRVVRVRGVMQDIDEAKRAEQRLRQSEERFSRIFHLMPYPMGLSHRSDGRYVDLNPAWVDMLGIPREEAIGRTAVELGIFTAEDRQRLMEQVSQTGHLSDYEVTLNVRNGPRRTVLQSMRATEFDGEPCWLFSVHDITDRKRNEVQVREREALLSLTISAASLGLWDWDLQTGLVTGDRRWRAMRGLPVTGDTSAAVQWTTAIAPDDIDRITTELSRHTAHLGTPFDATWRLNQPNEPVRWVRNLGKIVGFDEQGRPARMLGVAIDVTPQREQEVMLQRLALYDALTGLPNRVLLARKLQECMAQARDTGKQLGVAYLDLDGFKPVNDRLGHGAGDRLLVVVAGRLTRALQPLDTVARLGGDEFVILMPGLGSVSDCERMLERVMESVSAPYTLDTERVVVTASIGYTIFPQDDADADTLLRHADQAMYAAKQAGRNRFHQFDAAQERALQLLRAQGHYLREALAQAQFILYLQPKVDMRSGTVVGAEVLSRWQHPERGLVPPGEFLPLLEGTDLEIGFGEWVAEAALTVLEQLQDRGMPMPLSINIAAQHLQQPDFADWVAGCLARHPRVPAHLVEIEITESAALYDLSAVADTLNALRAMGVTVALDDFGTGYSSLTYLRRLPMDTLKIDQSFVHGMMGDPGDLAIVQGVIGLARSFGYRVIAEGVETVEQGQMLLQLGCLQAQGYCIARPMPLEDFIGWTPTWQPPAGWQRNRPVL
ncbi:diguanylate cyclase/phosphodiesterase with PAS/PAC sensor(s) [Acidovorax delafieldii]|uniref:Diguanylate cyclase/phosphodiesterase with PAS/PAC sensor(S) n=1 Tax=Acidovorax delafieldii TaxID=47920 RepID=A0A561XPT9_ACIDE|nr:EAL domain-containing protein [Acidovorax delafieldii]TWG38123.1 diguanylate cyclase/phosphodiesterase with PAS/PAC sensor(s) [Acidovorax delafieldii]